MRTLNRLRRLPWTTSLLLHLMVLALAPVVDGSIEVGATVAQPHLVAPGGDECPPPHDHTACETCRTTLTASILPGAAFPAARPHAAVRAPVPASSAAVQAGLCSPLGSRAPPRL